MPRSRPSSSAFSGHYAKFAGVGITFALTIGVFAFAGYWLDQKLGSTPAFLLVGVLAGFVGALISMMRRLPASGRGRRGRSEDRSPEAPEERAPEAPEERSRDPRTRP